MKNKNSEGKYVGTVKIGPKGQIIIPKEVREMFKLDAGDSLVMLADEKQGVVLQTLDSCDDFFRQMFEKK